MNANLAMRMATKVRHAIGEIRRGGRLNPMGNPIFRHKSWVARPHTQKPLMIAPALKFPMSLSDVGHDFESTPKVLVELLEHAMAEYYVALLDAIPPSGQPEILTQHQPAN